MFAKYKNHDYIYAKNKRKSEIITTQAHKTDSSFTKERNVYVKSIPEENLSTIFDVTIYVSYETNIPNTPKEWKLNYTLEPISDKVSLVFAEGILPGWLILEKNVCEKEVSISELTNAKVIFTYKKKDGYVLENELVEELIIPVTELPYYFEKYNRLSI